MLYYLLSVTRSWKYFLILLAEEEMIVVSIIGISQVSHPTSTDHHPSFVLLFYSPYNVFAISLCSALPYGRQVSIFIDSI